MDKQDCETENATCETSKEIKIEIIIEDHVIKKEPESEDSFVPQASFDGEIDIKSENILNDELTPKSEVKIEHEFYIENCTILEDRFLERKPKLENTIEDLQSGNTDIDQTKPKLGKKNIRQSETKKEKTLQISYRPSDHPETNLDTIFRCAHCKATFHSKYDLGIHGSNHKEVKSNVVNNFSLKCNECDFTGSSKNDLTRHATIHKSANQSVAKHSFKVHEAADTHKRFTFYKCSQCDHKCRTRHHLKQHKRVHENDALYRCAHCVYNTNFRSSIIKHLRRLHTGERPHKCWFCDYSSSVKESLRTHVRTHTGEKPYKCQFCDHACNDYSNMKRHMKMHAGAVRVKPYKCQFCDYSSCTKTNLETHARKHSGQKPYKCRFCNYTSLTKNDLQIHTMIHSGEKTYKCEFCDYASSDNCNMRRHIKRHICADNVKPYKCQYCNYSSHNNKNLVSHVRTHTGAKSYKCHFCDYACSIRSNLKRHERALHAGENPIVKDKQHIKLIE